jgi:hypothetical protein
MGQVTKPLVTAIYQHAEPYNTLWLFFMKHCLSSAIAACQRHMQPNDFADETMVHAYVTTDTIESAFGKLNQTKEQLSISRHFQPTPVQTIDKTINTVNRCWE